MLTETSTFNDWRVVYLLRADAKEITETDVIDGSLGDMPKNPEDGFSITSKIDVLGSYGRYPDLHH